MHRQLKRLYRCIFKQGNNILKINKRELDLLLQGLKPSYGRFGSREVGVCCAIGALRIICYEESDYSVSIDRIGNRIGILLGTISTEEYEYLGLSEVFIKLPLALKQNGKEYVEHIASTISDNVSREIAMFFLENFLEERE